MENATNPPAPLDAPKVVKIGKFQFTLNVVLQAMIFVAIVVGINIISRDKFIRADWSRSHKFSLSTQTKALLGGLEKPVQVIVCSGLAGMGGGGEVEADAQELLREYNNAAKGKMTVEMVNLGANFTRARELQTKYKFGANESLIILDYDGRSKFVYSQDMAEYEQMDQMQMAMERRMPQMINFKGEQVLTSALLELTEGKQNTVYLVTGHKEYDMESPQLTALREELTRGNIKLASLTLANVQSVPADANAVAIIGPRFDFSERELKLLDDYWEKKGRLLVAVSASAGKTPNLDAWLSVRGVTPQQDLVVGKQEILGEAKVVMGVGELSKASPLTKEIEGVALGYVSPPQSLKIDQVKEKTEKLRLTSVVGASDVFWGEVDYVGMKDVPTFDPKRDHLGPLDLGVTVEKGASQDPNVKLETSRLVVFGSGDFLSDPGVQVAPVAVNLAINTFNWLLSREVLVGIAPKAKERNTYSLSEEQLGKIAQWVCLYIPMIIGIFGLYHLWWRHGKNLFTLTFWMAVAFLVAILVWYGLLLMLGVEKLKNIPVGVYASAGVAVVTCIVAYLMHTAELKKKVAAKG